MLSNAGYTQILLRINQHNDNMTAFHEIINKLMEMPRSKISNQIKTDISFHL